MRKPAPTAVPILPVIAERWSPRAFDPEAVLTADDLAPLFEAARWAPSSANNQPWRYIYGHRGTEAFERLLSCLSEGNRDYCRRASVLIIAATRTVRDNGKPNFHGGHDLGLSIGYMLLQAVADGLAIHPMGGFDDERARELLGIPERFAAWTAIAIGRHGDPALLSERQRAQETAERERLPVSAIAFEGHWPDTTSG